MSDRPLRVVLGTFGFDQHEVGARVVASFLRDAGIEVIYVGRFNLPAHLLAVAVQEDAQVIAVSCHSWEYLAYAPELVDLIATGQAEVKVVLGGSIITPADAAGLTVQGVAAVLGSGATRDQIVSEVFAAAAAVA